LKKKKAVLKDDEISNLLYVSSCRMSKKVFSVFKIYFNFYCDEVTHVGSLSAALAGLHPMQYDPKAPTQVMAALGHYRNKQSVAVGLGYYFNDRFMMTAGVAVGSERRVKTMANVGFTLKLGKGSGVIEENSASISNEVKKLNSENRELKSKVEIQDEKIKNLEEKLEKLEKLLNK